MKNKADYSKYECPYSHLEKEVGHELHGPEGYENCYGVWCACGFQAPVFYLDPDELGLKLKKEINNKEQRNTMKQIPVSDLNTDNYTQIFHEDEPKFNAPNHFEIKRKADGETIAKVDMQEGPILESGVNGCCNEDLINIVVSRLEGFQASQYSCRENAIAITKLEEALLWLHRRTNKRKVRGVEGTHTI